MQHNHTMTQFLRILKMQSTRNNWRLLRRMLKSSYRALKIECLFSLPLTVKLKPIEQKLQIQYNLSHRDLQPLQHQIKFHLQPLKVGIKT